MKKFLIGLEADLIRAINSREEVDAVIGIKSEKFNRKLFKLTEFCAQINDALDEINDVMSNNGVFLGSAYENL
ncbi:hypothetical protein PZN02_002653 [Sinorhizobium garamanticum]|uniref:Uncharacterized protein n=1 Tax=Sinorhizobium garamanticum TaxID=680247 RepID=A0ABY8D673_9HYPH|nr:hypothetical protein [Sinorhizobium garamanticum]WEX86374.1 hypothetical protein PZN02_002653 [Sinorhizobium garamanticum]